jgi:hypothetical protein
MWGVEFAPSLCEAVKKMIRTHRTVLPVQQYLSEYLAPIDYDGYLQSFVREVEHGSDTESESD